MQTTDDAMAREASRRLVAEVTDGKTYPPGTQLPGAAFLAGRYGMPAREVETTLQRLFDERRITGVGDYYFAGPPDLVLAPDFPRPWPLSQYVGDLFSLRLEQPDRKIHVLVDDHELHKKTVIHKHDFCEIVLVRSGTGYHLHNRQRYPITRGDCFLILPNERHGYDSDAELQVRDVVFYPDLLEGIIDRLEEFPGFAHFFSLGPLSREDSAFADKLHLSPEDEERFLTLTSQIMKELKARKAGYDCAVLILLHELVLFLSRAAGSDSAPAETRSTAPAVEKALRYIQECYAQPLTPEMIAGFAYISVSRLHHLFREQLGCTVMERLYLIRLSQAEKQLRTTLDPATQIALNCGFSDSAHFSRFFKRAYGASPLKYRKHHSQR